MQPMPNVQPQFVMLIRTVLPRHSARSGELHPDVSPVITLAERLPEPEMDLLLAAMTNIWQPQHYQLNAAIAIREPLPIQLVAQPTPMVLSM